MCRMAYLAKRYNQKYCGNACKALARRTKKHVGYSTTQGKSVHRILVEKALGRKLGRYEFVHHKDGNKENNKPENLEIITLGKHNAFHKTKYIGCLVPDCENNHGSQGLCPKHREQARRKTLIRNLDRYNIKLTSHCRAMLQAIEAGEMLA